MVSTLFSDIIVNATELRKNQKRWLEKAYERPITISYGHKHLAVVNREEIRALYVEQRYLELVLKACEEFFKGRNSETFPWVEYLSDEEKSLFHGELLTCVMKCIMTKNWSQLEDLLQDWKATAETEKSPEIVKALQDEGSATEYVTLK